MNGTEKAERRSLRRAVLLFAGLVLGAAGLLGLAAGPAPLREEETVQTEPPREEPEETGEQPPEGAEKELTPGEKLRRIELSGDYPEELVELARSNRETIDFVYDYPVRRGLHPAVDLREEASREGVPLLLQWDPRWGYLPYGDGLLGDSGCGPLCLSMAALSLTGDPQWSPPAVARLAVEHGWRVPGSGSSWALIREGAELVGLRARELPLGEEEMKQALAAGQVLILVVGPGDFTRGGHFLVVTGWSRGGFSVNDPNSRANSSRLWPYERLGPQILNLWALEKAPCSPEES